MTIILPEDSSEPLYRQVRNALERAMRNGQFDTVPLPSSRSLAEELGVSRNTVNLAYQEMVAEGLIVAEERVGYRANSAILNEKPVEGDSLLRETRVDWAQRLKRRLDEDLPIIKKDYNWQAYPYPFIYGQVSNSLFPITAWNRALRTSMEYPHVHWSLKDGGSGDDPLLVEQLRTTVLATRGIRATPEEVLVTVGAQHGLFLTARALLRPDDEVAIENPGYPDVAHILAGAGAKLVPVPVDGDGLRVDRIPSSARMVSVTPSHQFPTNVSLSKPRREALLASAHRHDWLILEDDYDAELRYVGRPAPALRAVDPERVIYVGSFSKFLAPGLRMGYVVAPKPLIEQLRLERRYTVRHPPGHIQRALALMILNGDYQRAQRKQRAALREKWELMAKTLKLAFGDSFKAPTGGTSMWVRLPDGVYADQVVAEAAKNGVLIESGASCFSANHPEAQRYIRIGYAAIPVESIVPGLSKLSKVIHEAGRTPNATSTILP
ncbi:MAG: PLP-dependent aminotransferase family protein [Microbacteriaceae bacterium]|nr:PLP-dependent aminotransferase family protein [Cryobacterium sp.]MBX3103954.1 PLP-dependent aminotransferase family protein [Cryobacterium sp.]MCC6376873.1 PLP-dependent aminotransferase family protein [Microbacteriaceae bacterium]